MNILIDMNLSPAWADFLTGAGFTAVHRCGHLAVAIIALDRLPGWL